MLASRTQLKGQRDGLHFTFVFKKPSKCIQLVVSILHSEPQLQERMGNAVSSFLLKVGGWDGD